MRYIKRFEASSWWEDKITNYTFDTEYIKDILRDLTDDDYSLRLNTSFMNDKFKSLSKKIDALESQYYCAYSISLDPIKSSNTVSQYIERKNLIVQALSILDQAFLTRVYDSGNSIYITCVDLNNPFDTKSVDFKGNKSKFLGLSKMSQAERYLEELKRHDKILDANISKEDEITIIPKINSERVFQILLKAFNRSIEGNLIKIIHDDSEIIIKIF